MQGEDFTCFKFVDEAGVNLTHTRRYTRRYGRAVGGRYVRPRPGRSTAAPT